MKKNSKKIQLTALKNLHISITEYKTCCTEIYLYLFIYYERGDKLSHQSSFLRHQVWFGLTRKMDRTKGDHFENVIGTWAGMRNIKNINS